MTALFRCTSMSAKSDLNCNISEGRVMMSFIHSQYDKHAVWKWSAEFKVGLL
jgi:hypothetical protein